MGLNLHKFGLHKGVLVPDNVYPIRSLIYTNICQQLIVKMKLLSFIYTICLKVGWSWVQVEDG